LRTFMQEASRHLSCMSGNWQLLALRSALNTDHW
jgi:hypothetical protein